MITVIGDLHFRSKEPFYSASVKFVDWFLKSPYNHLLHSVIFLGDIFHKPQIPGNVARLADRLFKGLKSSDVTIIQGNHEYSRRQGNALDWFEDHPEITVFKEKIEKIAHGLKLCILPFFYENTNSQFPGLSMRKAYSNPDNFTDHEFDFIIGHIGDETVPLFMDADISHLKGQRILGHIHIAVNDNYLGTPYVTRADEAGKESFIGQINEETKVFGCIPVPSFLQYTKVVYGDKVPELTEGIEQILLVKKAPSTNAAKEFYSDYYVGKVELEALSTRSIDGDKTQSTEKSNQEYLQEFCEANKVDEDVKQKLIEVL